MVLGRKGVASITGLLPMLVFVRDTMVNCNGSLRRNSQNLYHLNALLHDAEFARQHEQQDHAPVIEMNR